MPIDGLTERIRFPRLGKLRLGIKKKNAQGVEYPAAVDYFVCDHPDFQAIYPGQPKALDILFPTDNPEDWARQFYYAFTRTRGKVCQGDGLKANRLIDSKTGEWAIAPAAAKEVLWAEGRCPGRQCEYYQRRECKELMMLQFLLPNVPGLGIWQLDTGSINSILNVNSAVALIKAMNHGHIAMVPLKLRVVPTEVSPEGRKKTVWLLEIATPVKLAEIRGLTALPEADDIMPDELYPTEEERAAAQAEDSRRTEDSPPTSRVAQAPPVEAVVDTGATTGTKKPTRTPPDTSLIDYRWRDAARDMKLVAAGLRLADGELAYTLMDSNLAKFFSNNDLGEPGLFLRSLWGHLPVTKREAAGVATWLHHMLPTRGKAAIKAAINGIITGEMPTDSEAGEPAKDEPPIEEEQ